MDGENNESDANAKEEAVGDEGAFNVLDDTDCRHANEANGFTYLMSIRHDLLTSFTRRLLLTFCGDRTCQRSLFRRT